MVSTGQLENCGIIPIIVEECVVNGLIFRQKLPFQGFPAFRDFFVGEQRWQFDSGPKIRIGHFFVGGVEGQIDPVGHGIVIRYVHVSVFIVKL